MQKDINLVFINLDKAYDHISVDEVWRCARQHEVPEKCITLIQDMYRECETRVRRSIIIMIMDILTEKVRKESMMLADDVVLCGGNPIDMTE